MLRPASAALLLTLSLIGCADDRRAERLKAAGPHPTLEKLMTVADAKAGARLFGTCAACHTSSAGGPDTGGPNLHGIYGQPIGQHSARFGYTAALRAKGGVWDDKALDAWIANPQRFVPGTKMQFSGIPDPLARADLIAYLRSLSD